MDENRHQLFFFATRTMKLTSWHSAVSVLSKSKLGLVKNVNPVSVHKARRLVQIFVSLVFS